MQAGKESWCPRPQMRCEPQIIRIGKRIDAARLGNAAADREIRLQNIDGAVGNEVAEIETGELAFAGGDRDRAAVTHLGNSGLVVGSYRFFEPGNIAVAHQM